MYFVWRRYLQKNERLAPRNSCAFPKCLSICVSSVQFHFEMAWSTRTPAKRAIEYSIPASHADKANGFMISFLCALQMIQANGYIELYAT